VNYDTTTHYDLTSSAYSTHRQTGTLVGYLGSRDDEIVYLQFICKSKNRIEERVITKVRKTAPLLSKDHKSVLSGGELDCLYRV
jgi:hypothetical protein